MSLVGLFMTLVVVGVLLWLLQTFGVMGSLENIRIR